MGYFIREGLKRAYEDVNDLSGAMWDSEEGQFIGAGGEEAGESLINILYYTECIFSEKYDYEAAAKLLKEIITESGLSYLQEKDGDFDNFDDIYSPCLVRKDDLYGHEVTNEYFAWESFKHTCKYFSRYFDIGNQSTKRENLLDTLKIIFKSMEKVLDKNTIFSRVRKFELENKQQITDIVPIREIGPAPAKYATPNRMSPFGISYMYLSDKVETCLCEIRARANDTILVGKFSSKIDLNIIDLSISPKMPMKSIFNTNYIHSHNWIDDFIDSFKSEISNRISDEDKEIEYIPTQVLTEYIRKLGYDGIRFESSVLDDTYNYVLFCGPNIKVCTKDYDSSYLKYEGEIEYFNLWLSIINIEYYKIIDDAYKFELIEGVYEVCDKYEEEQLSLWMIEFYNKLDIKNNINTLQKIIDEEYDVYIENAVRNNFNLNDEIEKFIKRFGEQRVKYNISVNKGFHFITINLSANYSNNKETIEFNCINRKADEMWNMLTGINMIHCDETL